MPDSLETALESEEIEQERIKGNYLNFAIIRFRDAVYFSPLIEIFRDIDKVRSYMFTNTPAEADLPAYSTQFWVGASILLVGGLIKTLNDDLAIEDIKEDMFKPGERRLIENGFYSIVRHPCYLGQTLMLGGWVTIFPTWYGVLGYAASVIATDILARREERTLLKEFGQKYQDYMDKVPRWILGIKPLVNKITAYFNARTTEHVQ